jgi:arylsulfatase A-like enzyme
MILRSRAAQLFALAPTLLAFPLFAAEPKQSKQPNILFIFSDDHALAAISAYNDPRKLVQTPNIDRLAREGMMFNRAMVPNSICGPSRACVLTGKYNHLNGFFDNTRAVFNGSQQTMPKLLHAAGYQTALIGKWHLISDPTGFDYWDILPGQGIYYNPPMIKLGKKTTRQGYVTDIITEESLDWLKQRDKSKPFLLMCQQKAPHREWAPNLKNLGWNGERKFIEPETLFDDYSGRGKAEREQDMTLAKTVTGLDMKLVPPPNINSNQLKAWNAYYEPRNDEFRKANLQGKDLVRWRYQRYLHDYLGTVLSVDESVGKLLKYLDDEGLAENTIVVYSSDQGFYLGEHGWFDKRWIFEESLRTPLIIRWPGKVKPGSSNRDIVANIDFASTFLEAAGQPIPADIQGRSLIPVLTGNTPADWRKSFYYHYYDYPGAHNVRRHYGVVTDRCKLVHFYEPDVNYWELFDLQKDPQELHSVYGQPEYADIQKDLHTELTRLRTELKVPAQDPAITYPP